MDALRGSWPLAGLEAEEGPPAPSAPDPAVAAEGVMATMGLRVRPVRVAFYPYADGKSTVRDRGAYVHFKLSDRLHGAPVAVLEGVFGVLLGKLFRLPPDRVNRDAVRAYKQYALESQGTAGPHDAPRRRGRKHIDPVGRHRSLLESYLRVSLDMGLVLPSIPKLSWSQTVSRNRFGHWDADHQAVVISQVLDDPRVPEFVLDYVLYHELLHIIHPVRMGSGTKRRVHTPEFRRAEKKYPRWPEGDEWIAKLASRRWRPLA
ncbi:MAG: hypothetical protein V4510_04050 [bacterium]